MRVAGFGLACVGVGALVGVGCAKGGDTTDTSAGGTGNTSAGGSGGSAGAGGGTASWPCGIDCSTIVTDQCHVSVCDETASPPHCVIVVAESTTECEDGLFCTIADHCLGGECVSDMENDCDLEVTGCEKVVCNESLKSCTTQPAGEGESCTITDDKCIVNEVCHSGQCQGTPYDCSWSEPPDDCHVMECDSDDGECYPQVGNEGEGCVDQDDLCTVGKTCSAGDCVGGTAKDCSSLDNPALCVHGVCQESDGACITEAYNEGDACDDHVGCSTASTCQSGVCTATQTITTCTNDDLCCPPTCNETNDTDCILHILLLGDSSTDTAGWQIYRDAVTAAGMTYAEHNYTSPTGYPSAATLANYNTIIWFDGYPSTPSADAQRIVDWMGTGPKRLFVNGYDVAYDFRSDLPTTGTGALYATWGITYLGDYSGTGIATLDGVANDPITGTFTSPNGLTLSGTSNSNGDYADASAGPAVAAGIFATGGSGSGEAGLAHNVSGDDRIVWMGFNFHNGLSSATQRTALMAAILNWFK